MSEYPAKCTPGSHVWGFVQFVYAGWTECSRCGFRPDGEAEFDRENAVSA
jgi:hypothetical protein